MIQGARRFSEAKAVWMSEMELGGAERRWGGEWGLGGVLLGSRARLGRVGGEVREGGGAARRVGSASIEHWRSMGRAGARDGWRRR